MKADILVSKLNLLRLKISSTSLFRVRLSDFSLVITSEMIAGLEPVETGRDFTSTEFPTEEQNINFGREAIEVAEDWLDTEAGFDEDNPFALVFFIIFVTNLPSVKFGIILEMAVPQLFEGIQHAQG